MRRDHEKGKPENPGFNAGQVENQGEKEEDIKFPTSGKPTYKEVVVRQLWQRPTKIFNPVLGRGSPSVAQRVWEAQEGGEVLQVFGE